MIDEFPASRLRPAIAALAAIIAVLPALAIAATGPAAAPSVVTVFLARKIVTMDATHPEATAVAVRDGKILGVGTLADLQPWLGAAPYRIDDQFKEKVLLPGLIDPHLHPLLGSLQFGAVWITPEAWDIMGEKTPATLGAANYMATLKAAFAADKGEDPFFMTWGYSADSHGPMSRQILDGISATRPMLIWHRSAHEIYANTPMLAFLESKGVTEAKMRGNPQVDWDKGHFWEDGFMKGALPGIAPVLLAPARVDKLLLKTRDYLNYNGITTVADMNTGGTNWDLEVGALTRNFAGADSPVRVRLTPDAGVLTALKGDDGALAFINEAAKLDSDHLVVNKAIKLFADGAMFSLAMQIRPPGYIDGHPGQWITPPAALETLARRYWNAGYQIHVHSNGDASDDLVLDILQKLQNEKPRVDARFTLEHYGYATDATNRRVASLGAQVSANPFYLFDLGDSYAKVGLGADRAASMTPLGGLVKRGVPVALHSDFAMAPAQPLLLAWNAITRQTQSGKVLGEAQRLTLDEAMKAITIDAAYILDLEDRIGSIAAGKLADFTVVDKDPYEVGAAGLRSIKVWGTVYEGRPFKAKAAAP